MPVQEDGVSGSSESWTSIPTEPASDTKDITYARNSHVRDLQIFSHNLKILSEDFEGSGNLHEQSSKSQEHTGFRKYWYGFTCETLHSASQIAYFLI